MNLLNSEMLAPALQQLSPSLTQLDLYDNQLTSIPPGLSRLTNLTSVLARAAVCISRSHISFWLCRTLDLSFNSIRKMENLSCLTKLSELYLANNRISVITEELHSLLGLTTLELGSNGIRVRSRYPAHSLSVVSEPSWSSQLRIFPT